MRIFSRKARTLVVLAFVAVLAGACGKAQPPVAQPTPPPPAPEVEARPSPAPPQPVAEPVVVPPEPLVEDAFAARSLEELNRESPLEPVFFALDSTEADAASREVLDANVEILKRYPAWTITIEGHCDERGTAEYNLALGERRALAARDYIVSLGISDNRLRIVSYGKEFPFDPGHTEEAWAKNRRAHFVITAK